MARYLIPTRLGISIESLIKILYLDTRRSGGKRQHLITKLFTKLNLVLIPYSSVVTMLKRHVFVDSKSDDNVNLGACLGTFEKE